MILPIFDLATDSGRQDFDACMQRLRATTSASSADAQAVAAIIDDVKQHGDEAVVRYMRKWTDPDFQADRIRVSPGELAEAQKSLDPSLRDAISRSIDHVRRYQQHIMPTSPQPITIEGAELGLRFIAVDSCGLTVPGGTAVLFSTLS